MPLAICIKISYVLLIMTYQRCYEDLVAYFYVTNNFLANCDVSISWLWCVDVWIKCFDLWGLEQIWTWLRTYGQFNYFWTNINYFNLIGNFLFMIIILIVACSFTQKHQAASSSAVRKQNREMLTDINLYIFLYLYLLCCDMWWDHLKNI